ncbi:MAG: SUMF1/EgtB/PvdO family nonheme iron enzyme [Chitinispirillia bacterium]|nr:SUMF1/EgtB/PvdO family nonheme iron enzyme [Chitinispirillia bacterium]
MRNNKDFSYKIGGLICLIIAASLFTCEKVPDHCGGKGPETWYNPDYQFCFAGKARDLCGGKRYNPLTDVCEHHILGTRCADESFVPMGAPCAGYTLTTATVPAVGGIITRTEEGPNYPAGYDVILIAEPSEGYTFAGWAGAQASQSNMIPVKMDANKPMVAMFNKIGESGAGMYTLFASAFPENGGTVTYQNGPDYAAGTQVTVTTEAKQGYTFTSWSGASTSTSLSVPITMNSGKTLVAMFTPMVYTLTVNAVPEEGGAVFVDGTALMGAAPQNAGTTVTALARPAEGYVFAGWSGAASGNAYSTSVTITSSTTTLTATFRRDETADPCAISPETTPGCTGYSPCLGLTSASPGSQCCITNPLFNGCGGNVGEIQMVFVQGGTFTMGCTDDECYEWEMPSHQVTLTKDFYIGRYEVTQAQWMVVMGTNPSNFTGDNLPVETVSWNDIQDFITTLNSKTTGRVYRLPTEAEWEYAARGGASSGSYKYAGSNTIDNVAWYGDNIPSQTSGNNGYGTQPVGTKTPNELGIYDMSGNVWEWVNDWYGSYTSDAKTNPTGPPTGFGRVMRGGSWDFVTWGCRVSGRYSFYPDYRYDYVGFRLAYSSP